MKKTKLSKTMSYILRHHPEDFGLTLDPDGSLVVDELLQALKDRFKDVSRAELEEMVHEDKKGRFSFLNEGKRIRANYGHSIEEINLDYKAVVPPDFLYHGTARCFKDAILAEGIKPMGRKYTHLSETKGGAFKVGQRRDNKPVIFKVKAREAHNNGLVFYRTGRGVYLTDHVSEKVIELLIY